MYNITAKEVKKVDLHMHVHVCTRINHEETVVKGNSHTATKDL